MYFNINNLSHQLHVLVVLTMFPDLEGHVLLTGGALSLQIEGYVLLTN